MGRPCPASAATSLVEGLAGGTVMRSQIGPIPDDWLDRRPKLLGVCRQERERGLAYARLCMRRTQGVASSQGATKPQPREDQNLDLSPCPRLRPDGSSRRSHPIDLPDGSMRLRPEPKKSIHSPVQPAHLCGLRRVVRALSSARGRIASPATF